MKKSSTAATKQRWPHKVKSILRKSKSPKPSSGDCANRLAQRSILENGTRGRQTGGSTGWNANTQLAPSEQNRSFKSADGRATVLLMEGDNARLRDFPPSAITVVRCNWEVCAIRFWLSHLSFYQLRSACARSGSSLRDLSYFSNFTLR